MLGHQLTPAAHQPIEISQSRVAHLVTVWRHRKERKNPTKTTYYQEIDISKDATIDDTKRANRKMDNELHVHVVKTLSTNAAPEWEFILVHIARARKAARLMRDLMLKVAGVALVLDLIEERGALARKLALMEV
ncbi:MAG: chaperone modulatory protein CbpM [Yoonia sp.]